MPSLLIFKAWLVPKHLIPNPIPTAIWLRKQVKQDMAHRAHNTLHRPWRVISVPHCSRTALPQPSFLLTSDPTAVYSTPNRAVQRCSIPQPNNMQSSMVLPRRIRSATPEFPLSRDTALLRSQPSLAVPTIRDTNSQTCNTSKKAKAVAADPALPRSLLLQNSPSLRLHF